MLNAILVVFFLITIRLWHLSVTLHDEKVKEAEKPQRRVVIERPDRGTITDRYGVNLAVNKLQYNAGVNYSRIKEIPQFGWEVNSEGKKCKIFKRKNYIKDLSEIIAKELLLDAERVEDLIHGKAAVLGSVPLILKENIDEREYFRLKMLEKEWPGLFTEMISRRHYPLGKVAAQVVGYMGAISKQQYEKVTGEMRNLRKILQEWEEGISQLPRGYFSLGDVEKRLQELEAKAYTITDKVGKDGVENSYDEKLKGSQGKRLYLADLKGNFLRPIVGELEPKCGEQVVLSISSELQEYAEQLLAAYELNSKKNELFPDLQPWIKGGSIVVMDPNNGEIYALASYPRFDPNDFITQKGTQEKSKKRNISRWLENSYYLRLLWDEKEIYSRERFSIEKGIFYEECIPFTFDTYIDSILQNNSPIKEVLTKKNTIGDAIELQSLLIKLFAFFIEKEANHYPDTAKVLDFIYPSNPTRALFTLQEKKAFEEKKKNKESQIEGIVNKLTPYFARIDSNEDKLLLADIYRIVISIDKTSSSLITLLAKEKLSDFRKASARYAQIKDGIRESVEKLYVENDFRSWKEQEFKAVLEKERQKEKAEKKSPRSYIDYLDEYKKERFSSFWNVIEKPLIACLLTSVETGSQKLEFYLHGVKEVIKFEKDNNSQGWIKSFQCLKKNIDEMHPSIVLEYLNSLRTFDDLDNFLWGRYFGLRLEGGTQKEKDLALAFYPTSGYGYSRSSAFAEATTIGSIFKLVPAYAVLLQRYQALTEKKKALSSLNPLTIIDDKHRTGGDKWNVGYTLDGKTIPMFYKGGRLPRSDHSGIGKVDLIRALETSSNPYFAILAGEKLKDPEDLCKAARMFSFGSKTGIELSEISGSIPRDVAYNRTGLYAMAIGQHSLVSTPLQTAVMLATIANGGKVLKPKIVLKTRNEEGEQSIPDEVLREIFLPKQIHSTLMKGLWQVVHGEKGTARNLKSSPHLTELQKSEISRLVGKTSTAEVVIRVSLDSQSGRILNKDVGFGAIAFKDQSLTEPELVVVVFLRKGEYGWGAAPLAVKIIHKWREIIKTEQG